MLFGFKKNFFFFFFNNDSIFLMKGDFMIGDREQNSGNNNNNDTNNENNNILADSINNFFQLQNVIQTRFQGHIIIIIQKIDLQKKIRCLLKCKIT